MAADLHVEWISMTYQAPLIASALFWILGASALILRPRWAIVCVLLLLQIDMSGPGFESASSVGFENAIKIILLPAILLWRIGWRPAPFSQWPRMAKLWMALVAYAIIATAWSNYPLSALKMIGYLLCSTMLFIVFRFAWSSGWITPRTLLTVAWCAIGMAIVQTYLLGDAFGTIEGRFTEFSDAQGFAAFLLCVLALLLCAGTSGIVTRVTEVVIMASILLTGSRYVFSAMIALFMVASFLKIVSRRKSFSLRIFATRVLAGALPVLILLGAIAWYFPSNRIQELFSFASASDATLEDIGTLAWRMRIYQETYDQLMSRGPLQLLVGSGTSSGGDIKLTMSVDADEGLDPNRTMHDEFLRCLYEWGAIGLFLFVAVLVQATRISLRAIKVRHSWQAIAFLGILPAILFSLTVENMLANSAGPAGAGYMLVLTCLISSVSLNAPRVNAAIPYQMPSIYLQPSQ
jgi:hypothetical protein